MADLRRVAASVSWLTASQVARSITSLGLTAVLARVLSPNDFGLMALVVMASGFVGVFSETGMTSALVRVERTSDEQLTSAFWLNIGVASALAVLGAVGAPLFASVFREPRIIALVVVALLTLPIGAIGQVPDALLQRALAFREIAIIEWLSTLVAGALAIILALQGAGVWALLVQLIGTVAVSSVGRLVVVRWRPGTRFRLAALSGLLSFGVAVFAGSIVNFGFRRVDNFIIGRNLGTAQLGYYALAYNLVVMPLFTLGGVVLRVMYPVLAKYQTEKAAMRRAYLRAVRVLAAGTLPLIIGLAATAPLFIAAVYGPKWAPTIPLVELLAVIGLFESVNTAGTVLYARGRPHVLVAWSFLSMVVLAIVISAGSRSGVIGAAKAYAAVGPLLYLGPHFLANRAIDLRHRAFLAAIAPALISSVCMGAVVRVSLPLLTRLSLPVGATLALAVMEGAIVYGSLVWGIAIVFGRRSGGSVNWILGRHLSRTDAIAT